MPDAREEVLREFTIQEATIYEPDEGIEADCIAVDHFRMADEIVRLRAARDAAQRERDDYCDALGITRGPLCDVMRDDLRGLRPEMVKARRAAAAFEFPAMLWQEHVQARGGALGKVWAKLKEVEAQRDAAQARLARVLDDPSVALAIAELLRREMGARTEVEFPLTPTEVALNIHTLLCDRAALPAAEGEG